MQKERKMTKRRTRRKKVAAVNDTIIINRFDSYCGTCKAPVDRMATACTKCGTQFKRMTTWCVQLAWLPDSLRAQRPDLEWVDYS